MRLHIQTSNSEKPQRKGVLQRKCKQCDQQNKSLQRTANQHYLSDNVVPMVNQALQTSGQPLDAQTRDVMESRFQHDFSRVRVHNDVTASASAQAINAHAYTVESHIIFGGNQYSPKTTQGQKLLAHELTHVVQQRNQSSSIPMTSNGIGRINDPLEAEADEIARNVISGKNVNVKGKTSSSGTIYRFPILPHIPGPVFQAIRNLIQLLNASCDRNTSLTWTDFTGTPAANSSFSALTSFRHDLTTVGTQQAVQAVFRPSASWVKPAFANPTNQADTNCGANISSCEQFFDSESAAGRTGGTFNLTAPQGCAASIAPNSATVATSRGECSSVLGTECDRVAQLESARLLRHEQGHYNIACEIAKKGTLAILGGAAATSTLQTVISTAAVQTTLYDNQTQHGCEASQQSNWETDIAAGLPNITIP